MVHTGSLPIELEQSCLRHYVSGKKSLSWSTQKVKEICNHSASSPATGPMEDQQDYLHFLGEAQQYWSECKVTCPFTQPTELTFQCLRLRLGLYIIFNIGYFFSTGNSLSLSHPWVFLEQEHYLTMTLFWLFRLFRIICARKRADCILDATFATAGLSWSGDYPPHHTFWMDSGV